MEVIFHSLDSVCDSSLKYVVIVTRHKDKWVFCKNRKRKWEIPGGKIEQGETPLEAAKRELVEETGAVKFELTPICAYQINNFGLLLYANVEEFGALPQSEIKEIALLDDLPTELSFPLYHPRHFEKVKQATQMN